MNIFTQFFKQNGTKRVSKERILHDLMQRESELAKGIFGPVKSGGTREFFCLDSRTWVWHEEWIDVQGQYHTVTTRYLVRPKEIVKSQNGGAYHRLTIDEAKNFHNATKAYQHTVETKLYNNPQTA